MRKSKSVYSNQTIETEQVDKKNLRQIQRVVLGVYSKPLLFYPFANGLQMDIREVKHETCYRARLARNGKRIMPHVWRIQSYFQWVDYYPIQ